MRATLWNWFAQRRFERDVSCPVCGERNYARLRDDAQLGYTFVECRNCSLRYYSPRFRENYLVRTYLHNAQARDEAISMYEKGVFFGEPLDGSPEKQKEAVRKYYDLMLGEQISLFRKFNGREPE